MRRDSLKLLLLIGVVGFAILYGMELSSSGIHRVYGPIEEPQATRSVGQTAQSPAANDEDWTLPPRKTDRSASTSQTQPAIPRNDHKPLIDRVSSATAETLHSISSGGIKLVVSLFDKVTGS